MANSFAYPFPHISYIISRVQDYLGCKIGLLRAVKKYLDIYDTEEREWNSFYLTFNPKSQIMVLPERSSLVMVAPTKPPQNENAKLLKCYKSG